MILMYRFNLQVELRAKHVHKRAKRIASYERSKSVSPLSMNPF